MKKSILTIVLLLITCYVYAEDRPTGLDKICNDMLYLSTSCLNAKMIPLKYIDKEVAIEDAKSTKNINNSITINKTTVKDNLVKDSKDDIVITTSFEYDYSNDFPNGGFAKGYNSSTYYK